MSAGISPHLFLSFNSDREQSVNPESLDIGLGEVLVELPQVEDGQHDAEEIYQDPDGIENIVSVGTLGMSNSEMTSLHDCSSSYLH